MISSVPTRVLRVALVSSQPSLERGVAQVIRESPELTWRGSAPDADSAIHLCHNECPDVLLVDSADDPRWDMSLLLTSMFPTLVVVALLRRQSRTAVAAAWARLHGVHGLVGLNTDADCLREAIRAAIEIGHYVQPDLT
ncbi:hypothetical protein Lesp02_23020 [Lentzea sp. NBRC 105346]|uniref:hypothetical protein n=1 Tax=Lentzea sp. NBRC 105346 TaxID=3032205 RepID=UPI0024A1BE90|nr:hypothetical protein [Lentzea sp. NBRC 105346]GLZ30112.1 hypothetical protein Lesp02_23020 [Lentzea sp. NBRC 105346]